MFESVWSLLEKTGYPWTILFLSVLFVILIFVVLIIRASRKRNRIIITNTTRMTEPEISYGRIIKVIDGDSIRVIDRKYSDSDVQKIKTKEDYKKFKKESFSVRFYGIDTPEKAVGGKPGQKFGDQAHDTLENFCLDKELSKKVSDVIKGQISIFKECRLVTLDIDSYGRSLCAVTIGGTDLSLYMLQKGLACVYYGRNAQYNGHRNKFESEMKQAMDEKRGMWAEEVELPREYKRRMRKG